MKSLEILNSILEHIKRVESNCQKISLHFLSLGDNVFALKLMQNARLHDASKFNFEEFYHLCDLDFPNYSSGNEVAFNTALNIHRNNNSHHPEYWNTNPKVNDGIHNMPDLYIAEMVCDWFARSEEFGSDMENWVKKKATKIYGFKMSDPVGKKIKLFIGILTKTKFKTSK